MIRLLEMLKASTALAGEEVHLAELADQSGVGDRITLDDLNRLQHAIGDLHQISRSLIEKIKYAEMNE